VGVNGNRSQFVGFAWKITLSFIRMHDQVDKLMSTLRHAGPEPGALDGHILKLADGIIGTVAFGQIYGSSMRWTRRPRCYQLLR
jgi:4-hydroxyphenylacetaldehyde oxime monooxygenase